MAVSMNAGVRADIMISDAMLPQRMAEMAENAEVQAGIFAKMLGDIGEAKAELSEKLTAVSQKYSDMQKAGEAVIYRDKSTGRPLPDDPRKLAKLILKGKVKLGDVPDELVTPELMRLLMLMSKAKEFGKDDDEDDEDDENSFLTEAIAAEQKFRQEISYMMLREFYEIIEKHNERESEKKVTMLDGISKPSDETETLPSLLTAEEHKEADEGFFTELIDNLVETVTEGLEEISEAVAAATPNTVGSVTGEIPETVKSTAAVEDVEIVQSVPHLRNDDEKSETPKNFEAPKATKLSAETEKLVIPVAETADADVTPAEITVKPVNTETTAEITVKPVNTDETEITVKPVNTDEAEITVKPVNTDETEITVKPVNTDKAEITVKPVNTDETEITAKPVNTDEAEITVNPVNTDETEITVKPVNTDETEITAKPVNTEAVAEITVKPVNTDKAEITAKPVNTEEAAETTATPVNTDATSAKTETPESPQPVNERNVRQVKEVRFVRTNVRNAQIAENTESTASADDVRETVRSAEANVKSEIPEVPVQTAVSRSEQTVETAQIPVERSAAKTVKPEKPEVAENVVSEHEVEPVTVKTVTRNENAEQLDETPEKAPEKVQPQTTRTERVKSAAEELEMLKNAKARTAGKFTVEEKTDVKPEAKLEPKQKPQTTAHPLNADQPIVFKRADGTEIEVRPSEVIKQTAKLVETALKENDDRTEYSITLNPEELGKITVKLTKAADGAVSVTIAAENARTQRILEQHSDAMQSNLRSNGVDLESWQTVGERQQEAMAQDYNGSSKNPYFRNDELYEEENSDDTTFADIIASM